MHPKSSGQKKNEDRARGKTGTMGTVAGGVLFRSRNKETVPQLSFTQKNLLPQSRPVEEFRNPPDKPVVLNHPFNTMAAAPPPTYSSQ